MADVRVISERLDAYDVVLSVWPYVPLGARVGQVGTITQSLLQGSVLPRARGTCAACYTLG